MHEIATAADLARKTRTRSQSAAPPLPRCSRRRRTRETPVTVTAVVDHQDSAACTATAVPQIRHGSPGRDYRRSLGHRRQRRLRYQRPTAAPQISATGGDLRSTSRRHIPGTSLPHPPTLYPPPLQRPVRPCPSDLSGRDQGWLCIPTPLFSIDPPSPQGESSLEGGSDDAERNHGGLGARGEDVGVGGLRGLA
ncbi:uncharacterized protein LOC119364011 isoform X2 [Triticum dicoccoides]|uniref:uncharacterized protein LOC119364011 isoform X2 n=1 Tax=Triticum dicoccoides TaxID=85692 RepID=UPI00188DDA25|nr:uncharacterized protein LOC119364011 isoform X2 [Triticum dicoccoides]